VTFPSAIPGLSGGFQDAVGLTTFPILGAMPAITDSAKTPFKPNKRCETQEPPDLGGGVGQPPQTGTAPRPDPASMLADLPSRQIEKAALTMGLPEDAAQQLATLGEDGG
jgi:hypothetical protein